MIRSFFRHLEEHGVRWLLVSGQATILYGAATFSEDIDLWVQPSPENLDRLLRALRASGARYYKLTPPVTAELASRHHGFHFTIPDASGGAATYLDVMGRPPRVGTFDDAEKRSRYFDTDWGRLSTLGIPDLVDLKKTQRPRDYPIIGRLVLAFLRERKIMLSDQELGWAMENVFSLPEFRRIVAEFPAVRGALASELLERASNELLGSGELTTALEDELEDWFDRRVAPLRKADRHFWRIVIAELKELRARGELMIEGAPV